MRASGSRFRAARDEASQDYYCLGFGGVGCTLPSAGTAPKTFFFSFFFPALGEGRRDDAVYPHDLRVKRRSLVARSSHTYGDVTRVIGGVRVRLSLESNDPRARARSRVGRPVREASRVPSDSRRRSRPSRARPPSLLSYLVRIENPSTATSLGVSHRSATSRSTRMSISPGVVSSWSADNTSATLASSAGRTRPPLTICFRGPA